MWELKQQVQEAVEVVRGQSQIEPGIGIIMGTGLGGVASEMQVETQISYADLPHFPTSTVETHAGRLLLGTMAAKPVVAMQGRFHLYEGYTMKQITFPVRVMKALGVETLIVSNIAGGMNPNFRAGDLVLMTDHINLLGDNPLIGPNDDGLGPRFPDMSEPYSRTLIQLAEEIALKENIKVQKGVYVAVPGPNLETAAEYRFLRAIGADMVGMSTVPEIIVAIHSGMRTFGLTVISDVCFPDALEAADINELIRVTQEVQPQVSRLLKRLVEEM
jgi:purine-nucleoside phosphorylase